MSYFASGAARNPASGPTSGPISGLINGPISGPAAPAPGSIYGAGSYIPPATVTIPATMTAPTTTQSLAQQTLAAKSAAEIVPVKLPARPPKEEKREFYDVEFDSTTHSESSIKKLTEYEQFCEPVECVSSDFYANGGWIVVSTHRLILLTKDKTGGVFWPLKTTEFVNVEGGFFKGNSFVFQSTVPNAQKRTLKLTSAKDGQLLHSLFMTNQQFHEYDTVHVRNRNNILAVFNEECETVIRFADALSVCSSNANALFIWLLSVVGESTTVHDKHCVLPLVKQQLRAAANEWSKSTMGSVAMDDCEMLDVIKQGSSEEQYYLDIAAQIAQFFAHSSVMKAYCGAIPLLDAYYYYGKVTATSLKSPEEFSRAVTLLTEEKVKTNHVYVTTMKGKQVLCAGGDGEGDSWIESASFEKTEEKILEAIDKNGGFIARNALIRQLGMPVGVCETIIQVKKERENKR